MCSGGTGFGCLLSHRTAVVSVVDVDPPGLRCIPGLGRYVTWIFGPVGALGTLPQRRGHPCAGGSGGLPCWWIGGYYLAQVLSPRSSNIRLGLRLSSHPAHLRPYI